METQLFELLRRKATWAIAEQPVKPEKVEDIQLIERSQ